MSSHLCLRKESIRVAHGIIHLMWSDITVPGVPLQKMLNGMTLTKERGVTVEKDATFQVRHIATSCSFKY